MYSTHVSLWTIFCRELCMYLQRHSKCLWGVLSYQMSYACMVMLARRFRVMFCLPSGYVEGGGDVLWSPPDDIYVIIKSLQSVQGVRFWAMLLIYCSQLFSSTLMIIKEAVHIFRSSLQRIKALESWETKGQNHVKQIKGYKISVFCKHLLVVVYLTKTFCLHFWEVYNFRLLNLRVISRKLWVLIFVTFEMISWLSVLIW